jgi:hypothetical protein
MKNIFHRKLKFQNRFNVPWKLQIVASCRIESEEQNRFSISLPNILQKWKIAFEIMKRAFAVQKRVSKHTLNLYVHHCPNTFLQKSCFEPPTLKIRTDLIIDLKITKLMSKWLELSYLTIAKGIVEIQVTGSDNLPF